MKKFFLLFTLAAAMFASGCEKDSDDSGTNQTTNNPSGLPKPKANEIYYTTTDGVALDLSDKNFYSTVTSHSVKKDSIFVLTFMQDVNTISKRFSISFKSSYRLQTIRLPEGITKIEDGAFSYCEKLVSITIPKGVIEIGGHAFSDCFKLKNVSIPEGVTTIGCGAFQWSGLTGIIIPESVTTIGENAFWRTALSQQTIPANVSVIGSGAFGDSSNIFYFETITPPSLGQGVFYRLRSGTDKHYISEELKIYVPAQSVNAYKTVEGWEEYADYIVGYNF